MDTVCDLGYAASSREEEISAAGAEQYLFLEAHSFFAKHRHQP